MNRFSQEGIWKPLSGSFYFWHSGKTRQLNGERLAPCGTFTQLVLCSLSVWGLFPSCFLTQSYFTRQSMPWVCGSYIPDPPFSVGFLTLGQVHLVSRLGIQAAELLGASEWGFRNVNKFIQPPAFEVGGTLAKLWSQVPWSKQPAAAGGALVQTLLASWAVWGPCGS